MRHSVVAQQERADAENYQSRAGRPFCWKSWRVRKLFRQGRVTNIELCKACKDAQALLVSTSKSTTIRIPVRKVGRVSRTRSPKAKSLRRHQRKDQVIWVEIVADIALLSSEKDEVTQYFMAPIEEPYFPPLETCLSGNFQLM